MSLNSSNSDNISTLRFGTDGVRGVANTELTPEFALALGRAAARTLGNGVFVIGQDSRRSSDLLASALISGLLSEGVDVLNLGLVPTPCVSFATRSASGVAGVVISASHNPMRDNGIKFFGPDGHKLSDAIEAQIEHALTENSTQPRPSGADVGRLTSDRALVDGYLEFLVSTLGNNTLAKLTIAIDAANGAASELAPRLFERH
jgi:phosphoglucosamine mutase